MVKEKADGVAAEIHMIRDAVFLYCCGERQVFWALEKGGDVFFAGVSDEVAQENAARREADFFAPPF